MEVYNKYQELFGGYNKKKFWLEVFKDEERSKKAKRYVHPI